MPLDPSRYKDHKVSRGYTYHYYFTAARNGKPTLILAHGFPCFSEEWNQVVKILEPQGYGLIVPDLLGYGGTSKPTEPEEYVVAKIAGDVVEILDAEGLDKVVAIGHDWGAGFVSRLYNHHSEKLLAVAFLALWYFPPQPDFDLDKFNQVQKEKLGYETFGYWYFFTSDEGAKTIETHFDRWLDLIWSPNPDDAMNLFAPPGAAKKYITEDAPPRGTYADYITSEYKEHYSKVMREGGMTGPLNWYKSQVRGFGPASDKNIPLEKYNVNIPLFYGATLQDRVCRPDIGTPIVQHFAKNGLTIKEYDCGHWVMFSKPKELSKDLQEWVDAVVPAFQKQKL